MIPIKQRFRFRFRLIYLCLVSLPNGILSAPTCPVHFCDAETPPIRFPFTATNHSRRCSYPGFHLACCNKRQREPILPLPSSGNFTVQVIDYSHQLIWISDPARCLPNRILSLNLSNSPFSPADIRNYTFLNCTGDGSISRREGAVAVDCLGGDGYTVHVSSRSATVELLSRSGKCRVIKSVRAPVLWPVYRDRSGPDLGSAFMPLSWHAPDCGACERGGGVCGFSSKSGLNVGCSISGIGASKIIKYGLILGLGIPGLVLIVGLIFYFGGRIRSYNQHHRQANTEFSPSIFPQPAVIMVGLDGQTIESYPKTLLGESGRLPNPSDALCAICLSDYQAKETLRTIPECNHYFHAQCIDEWLRLKGTCPLCRNSPAK